MFYSNFYKAEWSRDIYFKLHEMNLKGLVKDTRSTTFYFPVLTFMDFNTIPTMLFNAGTERRLKDEIWLNLWHIFAY